MIGPPLFVFGVMWLVMHAFGLVVEFVAGRFLPEIAARFGGFCFVAGLIVGGRSTIIGRISDPQTVAGSAGAIVAALCLAWRVFGSSVRREESR